MCGLLYIYILWLLVLPDRDTLTLALLLSSKTDWVAAAAAAAAAASSVAVRAARYPKSLQEGGKGGGGGGGGGKGSVGEWSSQWKHVLLNPLHQKKKKSPQTLSIQKKKPHTHPNCVIDAQRKEEE